MLDARILVMLIYVYMNRLTASFLLSQWEALKREAGKERCSMAEVLRRIVDTWMRDKK